MDIFSMFGSGMGDTISGGTIGLIWIFAIAFGAMAICGGVVWWIVNMKKWNIRVNFKLPRGVKYLKEGETLDINNITGFVDAESGKGMYDKKTGVVWLKRKSWKLKKVPMKPFNLASCIQGSNTLDVVQIGVDEYMPVVPTSYLLYEDERGEKVGILNLKADVPADKSWAVQFERTAKATYSVSDKLLDLLKNPFFLIGLTIFLWGIQMLLLWNRVKG